MINRMNTKNPLQGVAHRSVLTIRKPDAGRGSGKVSPALASAEGDSVDAEKSRAERKMEIEQSKRLSIYEQLAEMRERQETLRANARRLKEELEAAREAAKAQADYFKIMRICMEIAARIIRGDNVPQSDEDFLLEHAPGLYKIAMSVRNYNKEDPEDHESLLDDDKEKSPAQKALGEDMANQLNASASSGGAASSGTASAPSAE
jgi:hypothetical protein